MVEDKYMVSESELIELSGHQCWEFKKCIDNEDCVECDLKDLMQSKTPIEPSDDAIGRIKKLYNKFIEYTKNEPSNLVIREKLTTELPSFLYELAEIADVILAPQPKPFNEAEISASPVGKTGTEILRSKTPIEPLNRQEVEDILYECVKKNQEEFPVKEVLEEYTTKILSLIPTPIALNDGAKQLVIEEIKHIAYHFSGVSITDETAEPYAESLLHKLPQPKQFSEAEINSLVWEFLGEINCQDLINAYDGTQDEGEQIDTEHTPIFNKLIKDISTLTSKDNIKEDDIREIIESELLHPEKTDFIFSDDEVFEIKNFNKYCLSRTISQLIKLYKGGKNVKPNGSK